MTLRERTRRSIAMGSLAFAVVAPLTYALHRSYERLRAGRTDPSLILASTHVDYLWRLAVAVWVGGMAALWASANIEEPRRLTRAALVVAGVVVVLAWQLP